MQLIYTKSSWATLGFLRFCLAAIVFVAHLQWFVELPNAYKFIMSFGGKAAVLGFLLISGFSIGHSYINNSNGYINRRFLRIYPLYFFAVLLTIVVQYVLGSPYQTPGLSFAAAGLPTSIANLFFLQGFLAIPITYNGPLWSLSIEVFFYMLVPLLIKLRANALIILIIASSAVYYFLYANQYLWGFGAIQYAWPWLLGFLLATKKVDQYVTIALMTLGTLLTYIVLTRIYQDGVYNQITFASVALIILLIGNKNYSLPGKLIRIFNFLGELSYPLYLFHMPLYLLFYHYFHLSNASAFIGLLLISIIPVNYLFDHWLKRIFWKPLVGFIGNKLVFCRNMIGEKVNAIG